MSSRLAAVALRGGALVISMVPMRRLDVVVVGLIQAMCWAHSTHVKLSRSWQSHHHWAMKGRSRSSSSSSSSSSNCCSNVVVAVLVSVRWPDNDDLEQELPAAHMDVWEDPMQVGVVIRYGGDAHRAGRARNQVET